MIRILLFSSTLYLSGCVTFKITYTNGLEQTETRRVEKRHHTFVGGYVEPNPIQLSQTCPYGFQKIDHQITFVDRLLTAGTNMLLSAIGIGALPVYWYEPHSITIHCNKKPEPIENPRIEEQVQESQKGVEKSIEEAEQEVEQQINNAVEEMDKTIEEAEIEVE
jgi:hypothetical protein